MVALLSVQCVYALNDADVVEHRVDIRHDDSNELSDQPRVYSR